ncbi:MAG TPA: ABC transporter ATP-binding protein [Thermodesulfobacteriota bacterium]|nr:ABC transporter ATP-binding protein [Thermodesulfobacteriota bacterium]
MAYVEVRGVRKGFAGRDGALREVLGGIDLEVAEGEFVAVVGSSGSGKSTLVALLAGLLAPDRGEIRVGGRPVTGPGPDRGVVFQSPALLPWLTAFDNVALAARAARRAEPAAARRGRVTALLELVGLAAAAAKRPHELSGGMRQRVALARALVTEPRLLFLDEPFSALDALTRMELQDELARLVERTGTTVVMVTHDVDEALLLADRIVALTKGPAAKVGRVFRVPLPRPRERERLLLHPDCRRLRAEVLACLAGAGADAAAVAGPAAGRGER